MIKAGRLLCVDSGAYSDYGVVGFFVVLQDFDPMAELALYLETKPEQREPYSFKAGAYLAALLAKALLMEVDYSTLHLCDYNHHEELRFTP
jgi:hypothetical protein